MDKLRAAAASVAEWVVRSWATISVRAALGPEPGNERDQRGQGLAEYALILAGIAIVAIASLIFLGNSISQLFEDIINEGFRYVQELIN